MSYGETNLDAVIQAAAAAGAAAAKESKDKGENLYTQASFAGRAAAKVMKEAGRNADEQAIAAGAAAALAAKAAGGDINKQADAASLAATIASNNADPLNTAAADARAAAARGAAAAQAAKDAGSDAAYQAEVAGQAAGQGAAIASITMQYEPNYRATLAALVGAAAGAAAALAMKNAGGDAIDQVVAAAKAAATEAQAQAGISSYATKAGIAAAVEASKAAGAESGVVDSNLVKLEEGMYKLTLDANKKGDWERNVLDVSTTNTGLMMFTSPYTWMGAAGLNFYQNNADTQSALKFYENYTFDGDKNTIAGTWALNPSIKLTTGKKYTIMNNPNMVYGTEDKVSPVEENQMTISTTLGNKVYTYDDNKKKYTYSNNGTTDDIYFYNLDASKEGDVITVMYGGDIQEPYRSGAGRYREHGIELTNGKKYTLTWPEVEEWKRPPQGLPVEVSDVIENEITMNNLQYTYNGELYTHTADDDHKFYFYFFDIDDTTKEGDVTYIAELYSKEHKITLKYTEKTEPDADPEEQQPGIKLTDGKIYILKWQDPDPEEEVSLIQENKITIADIEYDYDDNSKKYTYSNDGKMYDFYFYSINETTKEGDVTYIATIDGNKQKTQVKYTEKTEPDADPEEQQPGIKLTDGKIYILKWPDPDPEEEVSLIQENKITIADIEYDYDNNSKKYTYSIDNKIYDFYFYNIDESTKEGEVTYIATIEGNKEKTQLKYTEKTDPDAKTGTDAGANAGADTGANAGADTGANAGVNAGSDTGTGNASSSSSNKNASTTYYMGTLLNNYTSQFTNTGTITAKGGTISNNKK